MHIYGSGRDYVRSMWERDNETKWLHAIGEAMWHGRDAEFSVGLEDSTEGGQAWAIFQEPCL